MKKLLKKFKNSKRGFSLVELIVVIAIMAVIAVILVPALMHNVEDSRKSKDIKITDELVTAVELALADREVYDEMLEHSIWDNVSCYIDKSNEADCTNKIIIDAATDAQVEQYEFDDDERLLDEIPYYAAGNMRGITITFCPNKDSNESEYVLKDAVINKFVGRNTGYLYENEKLYNAIRSVVGDKIYNSSQTYRNSDFTIFIHMGTTGGNESANQDAVKVYGQYNGTNLTTETNQTCIISESRVVEEAGQYDSKINNVINQVSNEKINFSENSLMGSGTVYVSSNGNENTILMNVLINNAGLYDANDKLIADWDTLINKYGLDIEADYTNDTYLVNGSATAVLNNNTELSNGVKIKIAKTVNKIGSYAFRGVKLISVEIPDNVTNIGQSAFNGCINLASVKMSNKILEIGSNAFGGCKSLTAIDLKNVINVGDWAFSNCESLSSIEIPNSIINIGTGIFCGCINLTSINFGKGLQTIGIHAFQSCAVTSITIPSNIILISSTAFQDCVNLKSVYLEHISAPTFGWNCFINCGSSSKQCTFYFKNSEVSDALKLRDDNSEYQIKSTNYDW